MEIVRDFVRRVIVVEALAVVGLLLAGLVLNLVQPGVTSSCEGFFSYRIRILDHTPAWLVLVLAQMAINGFWMFRLGVLEGGVYTPPGGPYGNWGVQVPINYLRIFAVNLIVIPASVLAFILIRQVHL